MRQRARALLWGLRKFLPWLVSAIGLPAIGQFLSQPATISRPVWRLLLWTPLAVVGALLVWYIAEWMVKRRLVALGRGISERFADASEADEVHRICRTFYTRDDHVINRASLADFMSLNQRTAKLFVKDGETVGLYIVFSLKSEGVRKLLDGSIVSAQQLNRAYAVKDRGAPAGLYVTNICARGVAARGKALESLLRDITERLTRHRSIKFVFARMANEDGGRLIRQYGFRKIHPDLPDAQIWKYDVTPKIPEDVYWATAPSGSAPPYDRSNNRASG